jgi:hypothetical protein
MILNIGKTDNSLLSVFEDLEVVKNSYIKTTKVNDLLAPIN